MGLNLMLHDGSNIYCDRDNTPDLFYATCGGMGKTGIILDIYFQLRRISSSLIDVETIRCRDLRECFDVQSKSMESYEYMFCWLDSHKEGTGLGRGVQQQANHCMDGPLVYKEKRNVKVPFFLPDFTVNRLSVEVFNEIYYASKCKKKENRVYILEFFYPLDSVINWNKVYGKKGFLEYQVVVPFNGAYETIHEILKIVAKSKLGSTVAAVKPLKKADGMISFPIDGITFAVDFKVNQKLWPLLEILDDIVIGSGGRVYLAKDARLSSKSFHQMYSSSLDKWESVLQNHKLENKFSSMMFHRLKSYQ